MIGAVLLAVAGVLSFGGGRFFSEKVQYVLYFDSSLKGLAVGSPVLFRGVRIGSVTDIIVRSYVDEHRIETPVYIELEPRRVERVGEQQDPQAAISAMVDRGLRAQLEMQSFVTGVLAIQLDFHPDTSIKLHEGDPRYPELPTIPSALEQVTRAFKDLPIEELVKDLHLAIQGINELARSKELMAVIRTLDQTLQDFGQLARHLNEEVDPLAARIDNVAEAAQKTLDQATTSIASIESSLDNTLKDIGKLINRVDGQVDPVVNSFVETGDAAKASLEQAQATLAAVKSTIAEDSELQFRLNTLLAELSSAARSIRVLADYLERHPESLLQGKGSSGGN